MTPEAIAAAAPRQMNLDEAYLCCDLQCRTVSTDSRQCPRCHSAVLCLANALDGARSRAFMGADAPPAESVTGGAA